MFFRLDATNSAADLEVTVRHLREENAKLIQLLRSRKIEKTNGRANLPDCLCSL